MANENNPKKNISEHNVTSSFISEIVEKDLAADTINQLTTRFPPEPNGYAHIGHTFACFLNHDLAKQYKGKFVLRLDDTNPETEKQEYVDAIIKDLSWLGITWHGEPRFASDDFEVMFECAVQLIEKNLAYIDSLTPAEMSRMRGTATTPGTPSQYRNRSVQENLDLFAKMRAGEFKNGAHLLRAKIDLANPNMKLRDPGLYRILHSEHYRHGNTWCIYPLYDFAQAINDATNGVTHSLCSLEFIDNRAIYDWLIANLSHPKFASVPHQYEFGRRSLEYTVVSKRKLRALVENNAVTGWDDPRMPTISGLRRRGVTPSAIQEFASSLSVTRTNRSTEIAVLENAIRDDLNLNAPRLMAVIHPLKVKITGLENKNILLPYWPPDVIKLSPDGLVALPNGQRVEPEKAVRNASIGQEIFIEQEDFSANPPKGFKRLTFGGTVRLRGAGVIRCDEVVQDSNGNATELHCTLLNDDEKTNGVIHWVSSEKNVQAEFRLYDRLFKVAAPEAEAKERDEDDSDDGKDFLDFVNPNSLEIKYGFVETDVLQSPKETRYQFERNGYFWQDPEDSVPNKLVFNRIIGLRDAFAETKIETQSKPEKNKAQQVQQVQQEQVLTTSQQTTFSQLQNMGLNEQEAKVLARETKLYTYFSEAAKHGDPKTIANWVVNELGSKLREAKIKLAPKDLAALVALVNTRKLNRNNAKGALAESLETGEAPVAIIERKGLNNVMNDDALSSIVDAVLAQNPEKLSEYRAGRTGLLGFFVGLVMKQSKGQANPQALQELLEKKLNG